MSCGMSRPLLITLALIALTLPLASQAASFQAAEVVAPPGAVSDDVYAAAKQIEINHAVAGDVLAAGEHIFIRAEVAGDFVGLGNDVTVESSLEDDLIAAGNMINVRGATMDDVIVVGNTINLERIVVTGNAYAAGAKITLAGEFRGDVRVASDNVTIATGTHIAGALISYGRSAPAVDSDVTIGGAREHHEQPDGRSRRQSLLLSWVRRVISWCVVALVLMYVFPAFSMNVVTRALQQPGRALGQGLVWHILLPPVTIALLFTVAGIPLAMSLLFTTLLLETVAIAYTTILVGTWLLRRLAGRYAPLAWQHALLGGIVLFGVIYIPIIGVVAAVVLELMVFGALLASLWELVRTIVAATTTTESPPSV